MCARPPSHLGDLRYFAHVADLDSSHQPSTRQLSQKNLGNITSVPVHGFSRRNAESGRRQNAFRELQQRQNILFRKPNPISLCSPRRKLDKPHEISLPKSNNSETGFLVCSSSTRQGYQQALHAVCKGGLLYGHAMSRGAQSKQSRTSNNKWKTTMILHAK